MLKNYLIVAIRNLRRQKAYSLINVSGLAVGLACCILILLFVQDEWAYDRFHENAERTYRVVREMRAGDGTLSYSPITPGPLGAGLRDEFPEVEQAVRLWSWAVWIHSGDEWYKEGAKLVDGNMLEVLTFPLVRGDRETALRDPYSMVISGEMARRYFADEDPMGKVLTLDRESLSGEYTVTGVWDDKALSTVRFDCLISTVPQVLHSYWDGWESRPFFETYIVLPEGYAPAELERKFPDFIARYMGAEERARTTYRLQPLTRIHLYSNADYADMEPWRGDNIAYVYLICTIGLCILAIACINFVNLTTARSAHRGREVGLRKVVGAQRRQLVGQFLGESTLLALLALVAASGLVDALLPAFNDYVGKTLSLEMGMRLSAVAGALGLALVVGILAGSYPAFFLSAFRPVATLQGRIKVGRKGAYFRKTLVASQFAVTILLTIGTGIIYRQLEYIDEKKLGFNEEHLVSLPIFRADKTMRDDAQKQLSLRYDEVKQAFLQHAHILKASAVRFNMGSQGGGKLYAIRPEGEAEGNRRMRIQMADEDFLETYQIELIAGRNFSDTADAEEAFILNETAVRQLGWTDPIGKRIEVPGLERTGAVIGVVRDYHGASLRQQIGPVALCTNPPGYLHLTLRIDPEHIPATLDFMRDQWRAVAPSRPFRFHFVDALLEHIYREDARLAQVASLAALLAVFVACLGLFGLALFTVEQRTREIGIRKVLGASMPNIFLLLSREFTRLALAANLLAWPIAYFAARDWLQEFAYRVDLELWIFLLGGAATFLVAWATVSFQALRAASANPVDALRCE